MISNTSDPRLHAVKRLVNAATTRAQKRYKLGLKDWREFVQNARGLNVIPGGAHDISPRTAVLTGMLDAIRGDADVPEMKLWTSAAMNFKLIRETDTGYVPWRTAHAFPFDNRFVRKEMAELLLRSSLAKYLSRFQ